MTPVSLIVARYLAVHGMPQSVNVDGNTTTPDVPTIEDMLKFCWTEFNQVPTPNIANRVIATLRALAQ